MKILSMKHSVYALAATLALSLQLAPASSNADEITTLFSADNGGELGGAVYFDLQVGANDLTLTGVTTNTAEIGNFANWMLYLIAGSSAFGTETNAAAWTLATTGTLVGAGLDNVSTVTLASAVTLAANTLYAVAMVMPAGAGHDYTNGGGVYGNADLSLTFGTASNTPFGAVFSPRTWNGSLIYEQTTQAVPEPGILSLLGMGLMGIGLARRRRVS